MPFSKDLLPTALAPMIWGSSYITATTFLPHVDPVIVAFLRALPAGLLILVLTRTLPQGIWWLRILILGFLNFTLFFVCMFKAAYLLPGGIAAVVGAIQPLIVVGLSGVLLGAQVRFVQIFAALLGIAGVALLVLSPEARLDPFGLAAGLLGAVSMACGTVFTRKWQPPVSPLTFAGWQMTAGGLMLGPVVWLMDVPLPPASLDTVIGFGWLCIVGGVFAYALWFRGIGRLGAQIAAPLGFLSPLSAVLLGWLFRAEALNALQVAGVATVLVSVLLGSAPANSWSSWRKPVPPTGTPAVRP